MNLVKEIKKLAKKFHPEIVEYRRHLHRYPELSFQEKETSAYVSNILSSIGIDHTIDVGGHGVVGLIQGAKKSGRTIALRADMDALPIFEKNDVPYKSQRDGLMHACGHDVHTSSLLGTAKILHHLRAKFGGTIKLIFQPAEERLPGGASIMIKDGVLESPKPATIFGQHVHPPLGVGKVGVKSGMYMASADEIFVTIKGLGGHAALPQDCIDPIVVAANLIVSLQQLISRRATPTIPTVLTFGKINSTGGATNIIPNEVKMEGTFRTMNEPWRMEAHNIMVNMAEDLAKAHGATCDFNIVKGYPYLENDHDVTVRFKQRAIEYLGSQNVVDLSVRMTAEDFSYFSQAMPACFYRLGTGNPDKGITSPIHTSTFDVDEACLETGMGIMAWVAISELK